MLFKRSLISCLLKARLSHRIASWTFVSIVVIEILIFIPSYYRKKQDIFNNIEEVSRTMVELGVRLHKKGVPEAVLLERIEELGEDTRMRGAVIYRGNGEAIAGFGQPPQLTFSQNNAYEELISDRLWKENNYDVAWSTRPLGVDYIIIVSHDATFVPRELVAYSFRITGLVILISIVVTVVTLLVLGITVIIPIVRLQNDLMRVAEALQDNKDSTEFYSLSVNRSDELGEVMKAFIEMFDRVSWEIRERAKVESSLRDEQSKSEQLLLNILPFPVAQQLKEGKRNIAEGFTEVTILFGDLVNFTQIAEQRSPTELVELLNDIFSAFDSLTEKHSLEKIKTIGDNYMVVGGVPLPRVDHAIAVAEIALDMQTEIAKFNARHGENFSIRIGINTGSVVAGVIGKKKFIYDLWGDAVNTASRMESQGIPNCIQLSETTYNLLKGQYRFKERGNINIKGKGEMRTYLLLGRK